jgi:hypothetical protein
MNDITIGYLSWKRHNVLTQTLNSHRLNGLYDLISPENRFIFFQEMSKEDITIANEFQCNYIGENTNIGILNAFIRLVEHCQTEYFIFCENDWYLCENKDTTSKILNDCVELMRNNLCDIIKLRHRKHPGNPLYSIPKDINEWKNQNVSGFPYKLESLHWLEEPNLIYNNLLIEHTENYKWYITTFDHQKWSNNIFISKTSYLKNIVLPLIKNFTHFDDHYGGLENILIHYKKFYGSSDILDNIINLYDATKIGGGEGLFIHKDFV